MGRRWPPTRPARTPRPPSSATAQTLAQRFTTLDADVASAGTQATAAVSDLLSDDGPIKPIATELAQLNQQINQAQAAGVSPNDLLDRRDLLLDKLSAYGQVSVTADPTLDAGGKPAYPGMIQVSFGGAATPLVSQTTATMPTVATLSATPGGQLGGLQDVAAKVDGYRATLATMAAVVDHLGQQRLLGSRSSPAPAPPTSRSSPTRRPSAPARPAAPPPTTASPWPSAPCAAAPSTPPTPASCARSAPTSATATSANTTANSVLTSITAQRQTVSGVSMDEEMANMIRFQRGYQAAARALTTMDDLLNTSINSTGRVGM